MDKSGKNILYSFPDASSDAEQQCHYAWKMSSQTCTLDFWKYKFILWGQDTQGDIVNSWLSAGLCNSSPFYQFYTFIPLQRDRRETAKLSLRKRFYPNPGT